MADIVAGSDYQQMQHMPSVSDWDHAGVVRQVAAEAQTHFPAGGRVLVIDESGFAKKGKCSVGVARQWNGRLGKVDNSQVGVFAALTHGETAWSAKSVAPAHVMRVVWAIGLPPFLYGWSCGRTVRAD